MKALTAINADQAAVKAEVDFDFKLMKEIRGRMSMPRPELVSESSATPQPVHAPPTPDGLVRDDEPHETSAIAVMASGLAVKYEPGERETSANAVMAPGPVSGGGGKVPGLELEKGSCGPSLFPAKRGRPTVRSDGLRPRLH